MQVKNQRHSLQASASGVRDFEAGSNLPKRQQGLLAVYVFQAIVN